MLGSLRARRRPGVILRALEELKRRRVEVHALYVGGARGGEAERFLRGELAGSIARDRVLWNHEAAERDMPRIVAASTVLVHLSEDEATAVTPLEAFAFGIPVVASRLPAFEEALGGLATLVARDEEQDPIALGERIEAAVAAADDEQARARRVALAAEHTWARNAAATVEVYRKL